jgi:hypothetical protein
LEYQEKLKNSGAPILIARSAYGIAAEAVGAKPPERWPLFLASLLHFPGASLNHSVISPPFQYVACFKGATRIKKELSDPIADDLTTESSQCGKV